MKSIPNRASEGKRRHALALPENGAQTVEPLYAAPDVTVRNDTPGGYTPAEALYELTIGAVEALDDARRDEETAAYYLHLGPRFFSPDILADAEADREGARTTLQRLGFWRMAYCIGAPLESWRENLEPLLAEKSEDWRFSGLRVHHLLDALEKVEHGADVDESTASQPTGSLPAYAALQSAFRQWLESERVRANTESERIQDEIAKLSVSIRNDAERLNLAENFDFDSCAIGEDEAPRFKQFLALHVALEREQHRHWIVSNALDNPNDLSAAYTVFIGCHNDEYNELHAAMVEEMFATCPSE